jgi:hypothetical protein
LDRDLVEQAQRGDREAFAILARSHGDRLMQIAQRILRDVGTGSMAGAPTLHAAVGLSDGRVLVSGGDVGGWNFIGSFFPTAEIWDPTTGSFGPAG